MRKLDCLCHLANADNVPSILAHGLLSTERLLGLTGKAKTEWVAAPRRQRRESLCLVEGVTIPDQRPMPPSDLACALDDGLEPGDRYTLLNSYVFLWPNLKRTDRPRRACSYRPQVSLTWTPSPISNTSARMPSSRPSIAETHDASRHGAAATHWCPTRRGFKEAGRHGSARQPRSCCPLRRPT